MLLHSDHSIEQLRMKGIQRVVTAACIIAGVIACGNNIVHWVSLGGGGHSEFPHYFYNDSTLIPTYLKRVLLLALGRFLGRNVTWFKR